MVFYQLPQFGGERFRVGDCSEQQGYVHLTMNQSFSLILLESARLIRVSLERTIL